MVSELGNLVIKLGSIALMLVYVIFAFVVIRQVKLMVQTFYNPYEQKLIWISWLHFIAAVLVLLVAFLT